MLAVLVLLGALLAAVVVALLITRRNSRIALAELLEAAAADARAWKERLGSDVSLLGNPGDNPRTAQLLADAGERFTASGAAMATADSVSEFRTAKRIAIEGLHATRAVRVAQDLDPGPELPPVDGSRFDGPPLGLPGRRGGGAIEGPGR